MEVLESMVRDLDDTAMEPPRSRRRRTRFTEDDGNELDYDRLRDGRAFWRTSRRENTCGPAIRTKPFDETWFDFAEAWDKVKYPKGEEPIAMMFAAALEAELPEVARQYEQQQLRLLVALCRELQRACGHGPFFLSSRTAGELLGVNHVTASRWLRGLRTDGILKLESMGSREEHRASRYRYLAPL